MSERWHTEWWVPENEPFNSMLPQTGNAHGVGDNHLPAEQIGFRQITAQQRIEERLARRGIEIVRYRPKR